MAQRLAAPFLVDWNGDGFSDLLVGEHDGRIRFFKQGTDEKFHFQKGGNNPFQVLRPLPPRNGSYSAATVAAVDFDGDGALELIWSVGGRLHYFRKGPDGQLQPQRGAQNPFRRIRCAWLACRFHAADWDEDGDIDLAVPIGRGVAFFENERGNLTARLGSENPFNVVLTAFVGNARGWSGYYSSVCMADWDADGDLDLLVGQTDGSLLFFERMRSGRLVRRFGIQSPFEDVSQNGHYYPALHAGHLKKGGDMRLLVGDSTGKITVYGFELDRRLRPREFNANPFANLGYLVSPIPGQPLIDAKGHTYLMFNQANVGRVSLFNKTPEGRLVNITPLDGVIPKAAVSVTWLAAGSPQDVDFDGDGEIDRLNIFHDGRVLYQKRVKGVLIDQLGEESPFYGLDLENGIEDAAVAGFLPVDWNGDGKMDLIVGAWGLEKLKYFEAGWCHLPTACNKRGICDNSVGACMCLTGYLNEDCSACTPGYFTKAELLTPEVVVHECLPCQGISRYLQDQEGGVCHSRGICLDDQMASLQAPKQLNRLQRAMYRGTGQCNCSNFFNGSDCSVGECPPGYEYTWDHYADHFDCQRCLQGRYKATSNNIASCQDCEDGTYAPYRGSDRCMTCSGYLFAYDVDKDSKTCRATLLSNLIPLMLVLCWGLIFWMAAFLLGLPGVVSDIRCEAGQVHIATHGHHLLLRAGRLARVRFWGTGVPGLDTRSVMEGGLRRWMRNICSVRKTEKLFPYKVHHVSDTDLTLFDGNDEPIATPMDASTGYFQVLPRHALRSFGFLRMLLIVWLIFPIVTYMTLMALFASKFRSVAVACFLHVLLGSCAGGFAHWLRWRSVAFTRLASDTQNFLAVLLRSHKPKPCQRGAARAVTARQLQDFSAYFQAYTGLRTTYYVAHNILKAITTPYQLSYAEVAGPSTVRWFVSHFWGTPFAHLISTVTKHAEEAAAEDPTWVSPANSQAYWICTFSNNQSSAETIQEELGHGDWSTSSFYLAMHSPSNVGTAMVFDDEAMPLTRSWCLFELLQTTILKKARGPKYRGLKLCSPLGIMNNGSGSMDLALSVSRKLAHLRLQDAQASVQEDKEMIENLVLAEGGFEHVNMTLIEAVREVLHAVQYSFSRTMQDLETDLAHRAASRARSHLSYVEARSNTVALGGTIVNVRPQWRTVTRVNSEQFPLIPGPG